MALRQSLCEYFCNVCAWNDSQSDGSAFLSIHRAWTATALPARVKERQARSLAHSPPYEAPMTTTFLTALAVRCMLSDELPAGFC